MKYFTPDLYRRYNSEDLDEAEALEAEWESVSARYLQYLDTIRERLGPNALSLLNYNFHDAALGCEATCFRGDIAERYIVDLDQYVIEYKVKEKPEVSETEGWKFSKVNPLWLYDELDYEDGPIHRILFSDGKVFKIKFSEIAIKRRK